MRVVALSRTDLGKRHVRLDPAFYLGRELVRSTMSSAGSRHVSLEDIVESIHDGLDCLRLHRESQCSA